MASKTKNPDIKVLKGQEAEDKVLEYMKRMNRPYGAVDVAANLKGAVSKPATQKILAALAERGELVQKIYGKTTFFVSNQANLAVIRPEALAGLEREQKSLEEENKLQAAELKSLTSELAKLKATPTDAELTTTLSETLNAVQEANERLMTLRTGTTLISVEDLAQVDTDWAKWRAEWVRRKKIFVEFWYLATDALPPQDASALAENLGIEFDTPEHVALERGPLCTVQSRAVGGGGLKRKRDSG